MKQNDLPTPSPLRRTEKLEKASERSTQMFVTYMYKINLACKCQKQTLVVVSDRGEIYRHQKSGEL